MLACAHRHQKVRLSTRLRRLTYPKLLALGSDRAARSDNILYIWPGSVLISSYYRLSYGKTLAIPGELPVLHMLALRDNPSELVGA